MAYGDAYEAQWGEKARKVDFYDVKGDVERLIAPLHPRFVREDHPALHPGRSASIFIGERRVGFLGELHPRLAQNYGLASSNWKSIRFATCSYLTTNP